MQRLKFKMEVLIYFENKVIKPPKQFEVVEKGSMVGFQYVKMRSMTDKGKTNIRSFKFPDTEEQLELYKL